MAKPRFCIVGPSKKFLSGISYYTIVLCNELSSRADVSCILIRNLLPRRLFPGWKRVGDEIADVEFNNRVKVFEGIDWHSPLSAFRAFWFLRQQRPSLLVLQWWTSSIGHMYLSLLVLIRLFSEIRVVMEFHEVVDPLEESIMPIRVYSRAVGRAIIGLSHHFVVHSKANMDAISEKYSLNKERISVIPLGPVSLYEEVPRAEALKTLGLEDKYTITFFGLIRRYKGVDLLIRAFSEIEDRDCQLAIGGEFWEDEKLIRNLIMDSKRAEDIKLFPRYLTDEEVKNLFSATDLFVLPYRRSAQSAVLSNIKATGKPVVITKAGGLEEQVENYRPTLLAKPEDVEDLKRRILQAKSESITLEPELEWDDVIEGYLSLFHQVARNST